MVGTRLDGHKIVAVQWASPSSNPDMPLPRSSLTLEQATVTCPSPWTTGTATADKQSVGRRSSSRG